MSKTYLKSDHFNGGGSAAAEGINPTYVGRILRLTLLAPDIVEAILDGRQPANLQLAVLLKAFPVEWERQWAEITNHSC
jgi:hypothetical protein